MSTTTTRRAKKQRTIGLVAREREWFLLEVFDSRKTDFYLAKPIPSDWGQAFLLEKQDDAGTAETYRVCLDGQHSTCDCKGHSYHGHCKHWQGLLALREAGKL